MTQTVKYICQTICCVAFVAAATLLLLDGQLIMGFFFGAGAIVSMG